MNGADYSLGTFYCKVDTPCAPGEKGEPSFICNMGGVNDVKAEDLSTSCGGVGFDIGLMVGRDDYEYREGGDVYFPSTCTCDSCIGICNPCEKGQKCKQKFNGPNGGFMCLGKQKKFLLYSRVLVKEDVEQVDDYWGGGVQKSNV